MNIYDPMGYTAVFVATVAIVPQIIQIIKTKKVDDINRCFFLLMVISEILYITYGILKQDYVMIASTIPPILSHIIVIFLHCKYKSKATIQDSVD